MKKVIKKTVAKAKMGTVVQPPQVSKKLTRKEQKRAEEMSKYDKGRSDKPTSYFDNPNSTRKNPTDYLKKGGAKKSLPKAQAGKQTPFQEYMKNPGAVASDTTMRTLYPNSSWDAPKSPVAKNPKNQSALDKAFEKTYGQNWKSESGQPAKGETFEQYKRRMGPLKKKGGAVKKAQVGGYTTKDPKLRSVYENFYKKKTGSNQQTKPDDLKPKNPGIGKPPSKIMKRYAKGGSTFGMLSVKAGIDKNPKPTAADRIAGAKMNKKKMGGVTKLKKK